MEKEQLEIKPAVDFIADEPSSLKIEIDVEELRTDKNCSKKSFRITKTKRRRGKTESFRTSKTAGRRS